MITIAHQPVNLNSVFNHLQRNNSGSIVVHYAVVKKIETGRTVHSLKFQVKGDLEREMQELEKDLRNKWSVEDVLLIRRIGSLSIGDVISVAAASAEHRNAAFGFCQEAVNRFKEMRCIQKNEVYKTND